MPPLTAEQKKEALEHVLVRVLDLPPDGPVLKDTLPALYYWTKRILSYYQK